jgi:hypothetical protein
MKCDKLSRKQELWMIDGNNAKGVKKAEDLIFCLIEEAKAHS